MTSREAAVVAALCERRGEWERRSQTTATGAPSACLASPAPAKLRGLNEFLQRHESRLRPVLAVVAGLLLAAAFPKLGIAGLAWVAPGLLLFSAVGQPGQVAFRLGWLGGFAFHLAALHWLLFIPVTGFPILGWVALSAYAAVYPGLWVWLCWRLAPVPAASAAARTLPTERRRRLEVAGTGRWRPRALGHA